MDLEALPLFPLNAVVFPGFPLELHVFEERYKALVADVLAGQQHFGVVAISSGPEVGGEAEPYMVGTLVRIAGVDRLDDGRMNLLTTGVERIQLLSLNRESKPYLLASARAWPDEDYPAASRDERAELRMLFNEYVAAILREVGSTQEEIDQRVPLKLPDEPLLLSILVGSMMQVPVADKQELLAARSSGERIHRALRLLGRELALLRSAHAGPALRPAAGEGMFSNN